MAHPILFDPVDSPYLVPFDDSFKLRKFQTDPDGFTLIMLDLTMPHMDGDEAFRLIRELRPQARVLLMSGFNEQEAIARFTGKGLAGFLQKPFTFPALKEKLQEIFPASQAAV